MSKLKGFKTKLEGFTSKLKGLTLVFTLVGTASLFTFVAGSQRSEASETSPSSKSASGQGASPLHNPRGHDQGGIASPRSAGELQTSTKSIETVRSLPSTEPRVPSEARLEAPTTPVIPPVSDVRPMEAPAAAALPSTPARNGPAPTEIAAYIALAHAKIQQGNIAAARRLLERASSGDEAEAWLVLAETYDPQMLARWGVYQEAQRRGAQGARARLLSFSTVGSPQ